MMIVPKKNYDLFDDFFNDPFFKGEHMVPQQTMAMMKTDIRENENSYVLDVDLPGFEKDNIKIDIENGYLNINAKIEDSSVEDENKFIRRERFVGECSRSFYIGDDIVDDDIKASFKNGILSLEIPKVKEEKHEEKKYIEIGE